MLEPSQASRSAPLLTSSVTKKRQWVTVAGNSLLRGTEAPICQPDALPRVVCCLPGAGIRDVTKRLSGLVQFTDYYPLLWFHMVNNNRIWSSLKSIKDYRVLGVAVRDSRVQVIFSSILLIKGKCFERVLQVFAFSTDVKSSE